MKLLIGQLRKPMQPQCAKRGLLWADVLPALETVESVDDLKGAAADPPGFLDKLQEMGGPAARKLLIGALRKPLEPKLRPLGLTWQVCT